MDTIQLHLAERSPVLAEPPPGAWLHRDGVLARTSHQDSEFWVALAKQLGGSAAEA